MDSEEGHLEEGKCRRWPKNSSRFGGLEGGKCRRWPKNSSGARWSTIVWLLVLVPSSCGIPDEGNIRPLVGPSWSKKHGNELAVACVSSMSRITATPRGTACMRLHGGPGETGVQLQLQLCGMHDNTFSNQVIDYGTWVDGNPFDGNPWIIADFSMRFFQPAKFKDNFSSVPLGENFPFDPGGNFPFDPGGVRAMSDAADTTVPDKPQGDEDGDSVVKMGPVGRHAPPDPVSPSPKYLQGTPRRGTPALRFSFGAGSTPSRFTPESDSSFLNKSVAVTSKALNLPWVNNETFGTLKSLKPITVSDKMKRSDEVLAEMRGAVPSDFSFVMAMGRSFEISRDAEGAEFYILKDQNGKNIPFGTIPVSGIFAHMSSSGSTHPNLNYGFHGRDEENRKYLRAFTTWAEEMGAPALVYSALDNNVARETYVKWVCTVLNLFRDAVIKYLEYHRLGARALRNSKGNLLGGALVIAVFVNDRDTATIPPTKRTDAILKDKVRAAITNSVIKTVTTRAGTVVVSPESIYETVDNVEIALDNLKTQASSGKIYASTIRDPDLIVALSQIWNTPCTMVCAIFYDKFMRDLADKFETATDLDLMTAIDLLAKKASAMHEYTVAMGMLSPAAASTPTTRKVAGLGAPTTSSTSPSTPPSSMYATPPFSGHGGSMISSNAPPTESEHQLCYICGGKAKGCTGYAILCPDFEKAMMILKKNGIRDDAPTREECEQMRRRARSRSASRGRGRSGSNGRPSRRDRSYDRSSNYEDSRSFDHDRNREQRGRPSEHNRADRPGPVPKYTEGGDTRRSTHSKSPGPNRAYAATYAGELPGDPALERCDRDADHHRVMAGMVQNDVKVTTVEPVEYLDNRQFVRPDGTQVPFATYITETGTDKTSHGQLHQRVVAAGMKTKGVLETVDDDQQTNGLPELETPRNIITATYVALFAVLASIVSMTCTIFGDFWRTITGGRPIFVLQTPATKTAIVFTIVGLLLLLARGTDAELDGTPEYLKNYEGRVVGSGIASFTEKTINAVDSGAGTSFAQDANDCVNVLVLKKPIQIDGIGGNIKCSRKGTLQVSVYSPERDIITISIPGVYIRDDDQPTFPYNLIAVSDLNALGWHCRFDVGEPHLLHRHTGACVEMLQRRDKLFVLTSSPAAWAARRHPKLPTGENIVELLHKRFHVPTKRIVEACSKLPSMEKASKALGKVDVDYDIKCHTCQVANITRTAREAQSTRLCECVEDGMSFDMYDLGEITTTGGNRYVFIFVVWESRFTVTQLRPKKSDALGAFIDACIQVGYYPKNVRSDGAPEYFDKQFAATCRRLLIRRETSVPYTQSQNGLAEHRVHVINRTLRVIMRQAALPLDMVGYAIMYATFLINHLPCRSTGKIPVIAQGQVDHANYARAFGCLAVVYLHDKHDNKKVDPRGAPGIYVGVGMANGMLGWLVWLPDFDGPGKGRVVCTVDAWFDENVFPLRDLTSPLSPHVNVESYQQLDLETYRVSFRNMDHLPDDLALHHERHDHEGPLMQEDVSESMTTLHENNVLSDFGHVPRTTRAARRPHSRPDHGLSAEDNTSNDAPTATPTITSSPDGSPVALIGPDGTSAQDYIQCKVSKRFHVNGSSKIYQGTIIDAYKNDTSKWASFRVHWNEDNTYTTHPWSHLAKLLRGEDTGASKSTPTAAPRPAKSAPVRFDSHRGPASAREVAPHEGTNLYLWQRATTTCIHEVTDAQLADYCFQNTVRLRTTARMLFPDNTTYDLSVVAYDATVAGVQVTIGGVDVDSRRAGKLFYFDTTVSRPTSSTAGGPAPLTLRDILGMAVPEAVYFADLPDTKPSDVPIVKEGRRLNKRGTPIAYGARVSESRESRLTLSGSEFQILPAGDKIFVDDNHFCAFAAVGQPHYAGAAASEPSSAISPADAGRPHYAGAAPEQHSAGASAAMSPTGGKHTEQVYIAMGPDADEETDFWYFGAPDGPITEVQGVHGVPEQTQSSTTPQTSTVPSRFTTAATQSSGNTFYAAYSILRVLGAVLPDGGHDLTQAPKSQKEAYNRPDAHLWKEAERVEMETLLGKRTYELVDDALRQGKRVLPTRWTYALKRDAAGNIVRYKARLVARGDLQARHTYGETSSPTARTAMIRMLLATAVKRSCFISSFDIKCAFVSALIDTEIFISLPEGYQAPPGMVARLVYCLYGTKQASRLFAKALCDFLLQYGFERIDDDDTLFRLDKDGEYLILSTYVDDGIACHSNQAIFDDFLEALGRRFEISAKGDLNLFCGVAIDYDREAGTLKMSQEVYVKDTLRRFGMELCHHASTPLPPETHMVSAEEDELVDEEQRAMYMALIGSLQWIANYTRPDICYAVNQCSRFLQAPGKQHIIYARHILRYLAGTADMGIEYTRDSDPDFTLPGQEYPRDFPVLYGYCDADHAGDPETRVSVSGFVLYMANGPIHWISRRQGKIAALSSAESEFYSASLCGCEVEYFRHLLERLGFVQKHNTLIGEDNLACVYMQSKAYGALKRSKHIDTRVHRLRQLHANGVLTLYKIPTDVQLADPMTKALSERLHASHVSRLLTPCRGQ